MRERTGWREQSPWQGRGRPRSAGVSGDSLGGDPRRQPNPTDDAALHAEYEAYRRRQVAGLLQLVPRDAIRDLYAEARMWASARGVHCATDPVATLTRFAEHMLPLPPFAAWLADRDRNPLDHLEAGDEGIDAATAASPHRAGSRGFDYQGRPWVASLHVFTDDGVWRGFLRFHERTAAERHQTAHIFLEDSASEVRERFREFDRRTLGVFLRSVLP